MGVPAFFRWLQQKFGKIIVDVIDPTLKKDANGVELPQNNADPNPNGIEFDNFYLDMNNIVHNCTHPEDKVEKELERNWNKMQYCNHLLWTLFNFFANQI